MLPLTKSPIRILVVDDHTLFRRGLIALLGHNPRLCILGDAADAAQAQQKAQELQPDLILLDNHLPGINGVEALSALLCAAPNTRILMLTGSEDENDLADALRGGASGYLLKTAEGEALSDAIESVMLGTNVIAPEMMTKLVTAYRGATLTTSVAAEPIAEIAPSIASLSPRELDILRGIAGGASNKEIARERGISDATVKIHVQHILRKLDIPSRVHAAIYAIEHGLH